VSLRKEKRRGKGKEGINLPHGRLKTLVTLCLLGNRKVSWSVAIPKS